MKEAKPNSLIEQINIQYGKLPPQAIEVEEAVLGAMLLERDAYESVCDIISPESFYKEAHRKICVAIKKINDENKPIDLLQVTQKLKDTNQLEEVGGISYIMQLTRRVASAAHIEFHARIIAQKFIQRELIRVSSELQNKAFDDSFDVDDLLDFARKTIDGIETNNINTILTPNEGIELVYEKIKSNLEIKGKLTGFGTGLKNVDEFTCGFQKTDLVIIAAESSVGKTNLLLTILNYNAFINIPVCLISFEMSFIQITSRIISQSTNVSGKRILTQQLLKDEITLIDSVADDIRVLPFYVDSDCNVWLHSVVSTIRYIYKKFGVNLFGVDYIQLMDISEKSGTEEYKIAKITRTLKNLAKELNICIIALSQLKRPVGSQTHKPTLDRLRGSGQIEEAADIVILLDRPELYGEDYIDENNTILSKGKAIIDIAKGRNIGISKFIVDFIQSSGKFSDTSRENDFLYNPDSFHEGIMPNEAF